MTATTDTPTVQPEVPAWLNLDGVCPPDLVTEIKRAADLLEAALEQHDFLRAVGLASSAVRRWNEESKASEVDGDGGALYEKVTAATGFERLWDASRQLTFYGENIQNGHVLDVETAFGVKLEEGQA